MSGTRGTRVTAAMDVLARPEGLARLKRICAFLDIKASERQEALLRRCAEEELLALFGEIDLLSREPDPGAARAIATEHIVLTPADLAFILACDFETEMAAMAIRAGLVA